MKLQDFIKGAIVEIMSGIKSADIELEQSGAGSIYKSPFERTMSQTLVNLGIVRDNQKRPVLIVGFDVAVVAQEHTQQSDKAGAGVNVPLLSVIGFKASLEAESGKDQTSSNTHRITFSVPISFHTPS